MDIKTIGIASVVAAALFAGVLLIPVGKKTTFGPATERVDARFDPRKAPATPDERKQVEADRLKGDVIVAGYATGRDISEAEVSAARNDGPKMDGYVRYAVLDRLDAIPQDHPEFTGKNVACAAVRNGEYTSHMMFVYDAGMFGGDEAMTVPEWIASGCAKAIKGSGYDLTAAQFSAKLTELQRDKTTASAKS